MYLYELKRKQKVCFSTKLLRFNKRQGYFDLKGNLSKHRKIKDKYDFTYADLQILMKHSEDSDDNGRHCLFGHWPEL